VELYLHFPIRLKVIIEYIIKNTDKFSFWLKIRRLNPIRTLEIYIVLHSK
jgi:hypothetical protein